MRTRTGHNLLGIKGPVPERPTLDDFTFIDEIQSVDEPVPQGFKLSVTNILEHAHNWYRHVYHYGFRIDDHVRRAVEKMLDCGKTVRASQTYHCSDCRRLITFPFSCNGPVCSRCGKRYAKKMGDRLTQNYYKVNHRHFVFTIPDYLRPVLRREQMWEYLFAMLCTSLDTMKHMFEEHPIFKKKGLEVVPGMIAVIHTTGRGLNFQPHIHLIMTEGGLDQHGEWQPCEKIEYRVLSEEWQKRILRKFRNILDQHAEQKDGNYWRCRNLLSKAAMQKLKWKEWQKRGKRRVRVEVPRKGFLVKAIDYLDPATGKKTVTIPASRMNGLGKYLARYIRHPPIGDSRLLNYDGNHVRQRYEWDGRYQIGEVSIRGFMDAVVWNVPPSRKRVICYRGLYAPNKKRDYMEIMKGLQLLFHRIYSSLAPGQRRLYANPLCNQCGAEMEFLCGHYTRADGVVKNYSSWGGNPQALGLIC